MCSSAAAALALGELIGGTFRAGALLAGGATAAHLNGGEGAGALGAVVVGAAGNRTLDAGVGIHTVIHGKTLLLKVYG